MKLSRNKMLLVSFMLFSLFFGAGNLIFPPFLGQNAGSHTLPAMLGFLATAVVLLVAGLQRFKGAQLMVPLQVSNLKKLDAAGTYFVVDELPASASHHEFVQATAAMNRRLEEFDLDEAEKVEDNSDNGEAIEEGNVVAEPQKPAEAPETPAPEDEAEE